MGNVKKTPEYIPAFRFRSLTKFFDYFLKITMREDFIKSRLIQAAAIGAETKLLDFGSGTGTLLALAHRQSPLASLTGVDIDPVVVNLARSKLGTVGVTMDLYDGLRLPYEDDTFDVVLSSLATHHIRSGDKVRIFSEIFRVLKPGGRFLNLDFARPTDWYSKIVTAILKRVEPIQDHIEGRIPEFLTESGFRNKGELGYFQTLFGALTIYCGEK